MVVERNATLSDIKRWMRNGFQRAILDEPTRNRLISELEAWMP